MSSTLAFQRGFAPLSAAAGMLDRAITALRMRRECRRAARELAMIDDRELADMGLNRGDIYRIAHGLPIERRG
jgi:uncharacterized protein YjiS (DUF1127 family)